MGQLASVFDCAVNPLAPPPTEDGDAMEGPPKPVVIDPPTPLRDSALWRLQREFYATKGLSAWADAIVPNFVTTNSFIARAYAKVILGLLRDTFEVPPRPVRPGERAPASASAAAGRVYPEGTDPTQPVYIIELGAGHGKLGYLVVETLLRYRSFFPPCGVPRGGLPFKYVLTDAFPAAVEAWKTHPSLKDFFELGVLDVAVFDAERDTRVVCAFGGETLEPGAPCCANPMLVIANYALDSLTVDAFRITVPPAPVPPPANRREGEAAAAAAASVPVLEQACVSITSSAHEDREKRRQEQEGNDTGAGAGAAGAGAGASSGPHSPLDPGLISRMSLAWSYTPLPPQQQASPATAGHVRVYDDPMLDGLLTAYVRTQCLTLPPLAAPAASPPGPSSSSSSQAPAGQAQAVGGGASLLVPLGGFRALRSLLSISGGKLVALVGDKGYTRLGELVGHRDPHVAVHGSFSTMVNFHALAEVAKAYGATVLQTPYVDGFKVAALLFGSTARGSPQPLTTELPVVSGNVPSTTAGGFTRDEEDDVPSLLLSEVTPPCAPVGRATHPSTPRPTSLAASGRPFPHTRWGFREGLEGLGPEDFSTLQRCVKEEAPNPSLKHLLALLRLGNHDSEVFYKFKQVFIDKSAFPQIHDNLGRDVRGDVDRVYASYFPLVAAKDVCFELGRMLMGLRDYGSAIEFFNKSNETCGPHHITWHNAGICFYYLEDYESALECFKASLELAPSYGEAKLWWDRTAMKISGSAAAAAGGGEGDRVGATTLPSSGPGAGGGSSSTSAHDAAFDVAAASSGASEEGGRDAASGQGRDAASTARGAAGGDGAADEDDSSRR